MEPPSGGTVKRESGGVRSQRREAGAAEAVFPATSVALRVMECTPSVRVTAAPQAPSMQIDSEATPEVPSDALGLSTAADTNQPPLPSGAGRSLKTWRG